MTRTRVAIGLLGLGLVLAGCGSSSGGGSGEADKTADQILADAVKALESASGLHVSGTATGSQSGSIDADVASGGAARGSLVINGVTAHFVVLAGKFYLQGKDFFAKIGGPQAAAVVGDSWVAVPASQATASLAMFTDLKTLGTCLSIDHGTLSKGGTTTVNGQAAVIIVDKADKPGTAPGKLYVATSGTAYPLRLDITGDTSPGTPPGGDRCGGSTGGSNGSNKGTFTFTNFNGSVTVTAPPNPLDASSLLGGG